MLSVPCSFQGNDVTSSLVPCSFRGYGPPAWEVWGMVPGEFGVWSKEGGMVPEGVWYTLLPPVLTSSGSHQSRQYASSWNSFLLPSTTKLQQSNVFTPVCHSVRRGVSATPRPTPSGRHPPGQTPPAQCILGYGQQAGSTHPTGLHSCFNLLRLCQVHFAQICYSEKGAG